MLITRRVGPEQQTTIRSARAHHLSGFCQAFFNRNFHMHDSLAKQYDWKTQARLSR